MQNAMRAVALTSAVLLVFAAPPLAAAQRRRAQRSRTAATVAMAPPLPPGTRFLETMRPGAPGGAPSDPVFDVLRRSRGIVEVTPSALAEALRECPRDDAPCPLVEALRGRRLLLHGVTISAGASTDTRGTTRLVLKALLNPGARGAPYITLDAAPAVAANGSLDLVSPLFEARLSEPIASARFGDPLVELGGELIVELGEPWTRTVGGRTVRGYVVRMIAMRVFDRYDGAVIAAWPRGTATEVAMEVDSPAYAAFDPQQLPAPDALPAEPPAPPAPVPNQVAGFPGISWDDTPQTISERYEAAAAPDEYRRLFNWPAAQVLRLQNYRARPGARRIGFANVFERVYVRFVGDRLETVTGQYGTGMLEGVRGTQRSRMEADALGRMGRAYDPWPDPLVPDPAGRWQCEDRRGHRVCETDQEDPLLAPWTCRPPERRYILCHRPFDESDRVLTAVFYDSVAAQVRDERNVGWWIGAGWRAYLVTAAGISVGWPRVLELRVERIAPPAPTSAVRDAPAVSTRSDGSGVSEDPAQASDSPAPTP